MLRYARLRGNNKFVMTRCFASDDFGSSIKSIGPSSGALVGNPTIELNNCDFKGTGIIAFNSGGGAYGPIINLTNCLYQVGLFPLPFIATDGSNTVAALPTVIKDLKAQGYDFATVGDLVVSDPPGPNDMSVDGKGVKE